MSTPNQSRTETPLLSLRHLKKSFGPVHAVNDVSLDIYPGEVIGLVGDNAAGKSTFLSLLTGYNLMDSGEIYYKGRPVTVKSPRSSRQELKIEMIYQNLSLAPDLPIWQNLFLGEEITFAGIFNNRRRMINESQRVVRELNAKANPTDLVGTLSGGEQQLVAIARALLFSRELIIMDEPTAAISVAKIDEVLKLIRHLKAQGKSVLLVSHRLEDILTVADRIVVFAHGKIKQIMENRNISLEDLVHAMFDRTPEEEVKDVH
ncbi:ATP-binding cassette domain-containing protein [Sulfobacillus thermosulfidooxidans]|uniref:ATP-binding cassette domain-containing protein n=1 Tax=Sulfobacillus thermosulfidooxidans TaxID=28034 RepID=UPI0002E03675|nr:ATP-binding cassette domain-containing protein [Sulfobacillus thermosulfidooxidans]